MMNSHSRKGGYDSQGQHASTDANGGIWLFYAMSANGGSLMDSLLEFYESL